MKICNHCGKQKPLIEIEIAKNCFRLWCKDCCAHYNKWQEKKLRQCLQTRFSGMISRCTDGTNPAYSDYGGRGIECRFNSSQELIDYITIDLGFDTLVKVKGLDIDRTDNDGHYESGNIQLVTRSENMKNRNRA